MTTYEEEIEEFCRVTMRRRKTSWNIHGWDMPYIAPFPPNIWESFEKRGIEMCWPYVFAGVLKISTLAQLRLVCKNWNEIIGKTNEIWRDVFFRTLRGFVIEEYCGQKLDEESSILQKEDVDWHTIAKEAFTTPFVQIQDDVYGENEIGMDQDVYDAMKAYRKAQGVINWTFFKPHKIWAKLYKKSIPTYLHKIAVIIAVNNAKKFTIGTDLRQLLWDNDWERTTKEKLEKWGSVQISSMGYMSPVYGSDMIELCKNPPYGIQFPTPGKRQIAESRIREHLFPDPELSESNPGINWIRDWKNMTIWAPLWRSGSQWWGCHCHSHYVQSDKILVVSTASATD